MGLVGLGEIGSAVAGKLTSWDLRILVADPFITEEHARSLRVRRVDLDTLCRESDYVSLHVPLLPETHHLIGRREFAIMKPG